MSIRNLLMKVATAKNPYNTITTDIIKETQYISWRKYLQKSATNNIPLFLKLINNVDKSINLPLYQVIEKLFLNEKCKYTKSIYKSEIISSCFRNSSLPPIGLMLISLYIIATESISSNVPKIVHNLGYASELIQIAFEIHQCILNDSIEKQFNNDIYTHLNNKYVILLGDYLFSQSTIILSSLLSPTIVDIMSQSISNISRYINEKSDQNLINMIFNKNFKNYSNLIGSCLPYCFYALSFILYNNLNNNLFYNNSNINYLFFTFGENITYLIKLKQLQYEIEELKLLYLNYMKSNKPTKFQLINNGSCDQIINFKSQFDKNDYNLENQNDIIFLNNLFINNFEINKIKNYFIDPKNNELSGDLLVLIKNPYFYDNLINNIKHQRLELIKLSKMFLTDLNPNNLKVKKVFDIFF